MKLSIILLWLSGAGSIVFGIITMLVFSCMIYDTFFDPNRALRASFARFSGRSYRWHWKRYLLLFLSCLALFSYLKGWLVLA